MSRTTVSSTHLDLFVFSVLWSSCFAHTLRHVAHVLTLCFVTRGVLMHTCFGHVFLYWARRRLSLADIVQSRHKYCITSQYRLPDICVILCGTKAFSIPIPWLLRSYGIGTNTMTTTVLRYRYQYQHNNQYNYLLIMLRWVCISRCLYKWESHWDMSHWDMSWKYRYNRATGTQGRDEGMVTHCWRGRRSVGVSGAASHALQADSLSRDVTAPYLRNWRLVRIKYVLFVYH